MITYSTYTYAMFMLRMLYHQCQNLQKLILYFTFAYLFIL